MEVDSAFALVRHAIESGNAAGGYLIVGDVRGNAMELAQKILLTLFPDAREQIAARTHPDVIWLEPEGKARNIKVDSVREKLVEPMASTSFSGGWKVGVVVGADRMWAEAANAFLKTLEEPTPKTMYLLLTDSPEELLPTIISRTQRIELGTGDRERGFLLRQGYGGQAGNVDDYAIAEAVKARDIYGLVEIFAQMKEDAGPENLPQARKEFFRAIMALVREEMVDAKTPDEELYRKFRNVEAVESAYRQSEAHIGDEAVISQMIDRLA